jgi:hypothetical protein
MGKALVDLSLLLNSAFHHSQDLEFALLSALEPLTALPDVRRIADLHRTTVNRSHEIDGHHSSTSPFEVSSGSGSCTPYRVARKSSIKRLTNLERFMFSSAAAIRSAPRTIAATQSPQYSYSSETSPTSHYSRHETRPRLHWPADFPYCKSARKTRLPANFLGHPRTGSLPASQLALSCPGIPKFLKPIAQLFQ